MRCENSRIRVRCENSQHTIAENDRLQESGKWRCVQWRVPSSSVEHIDASADRKAQDRSSSASLRAHVHDITGRTHAHETHIDRTK